MNRGKALQYKVQVTKSPVYASEQIHLLTVPCSLQDTLTSPPTEGALLGPLLLRSTLTCFARLCLFYSTPIWLIPCPQDPDVLQLMHYRVSLLCIIFTMESHSRESEHVVATLQCTHASLACSGEQTLPMQGALIRSSVQYPEVLQLQVTKVRKVHTSGMPYRIRESHNPPNVLLEATSQKKSKQSRTNYVVEQKIGSFTDSMPASLPVCVPSSNASRQSSS